MFDRIVIGVFVGLLIGLGWLILHANGKWDECRSKGGYVVELTSGYVCAKLEVIK